MNAEERNQLLEQVRAELLNAAEAARQMGDEMAQMRIIVKRIRLRKLFIRAALAQNRSEGRLLKKVNHLSKLWHIYVL